MAKHILKSVTVVDYNADIPVKTFIGKRDLLKKTFNNALLMKIYWNL